MKEFWREHHTLGLLLVLAALAYLFTHRHAPSRTSMTPAIGDYPIADTTPVIDTPQTPTYLAAQVQAAPAPIQLDLSQSPYRDAMSYDNMTSAVVVANMGVRDGDEN